MARRKSEGTERRITPAWCEWCDRPARYAAEGVSGRSVDVCSMDQHSPRLTGRYRLIRRSPREKTNGNR